MQAPSHPQFVQTVPVPVTLRPMPDAGYTASSGLFLPVQAGYVEGVAMLLQAGYVAGSHQPGAARANLPETQWSIPPKVFFGRINQHPAPRQKQGSTTIPSSTPCNSPPVWETSNVVKEAELGNYHQQTEEFGYLAMGPVQGFPPVVLPSPGVGVLWGYPLPYPYPYPDFGYRLLYGLYPPGTYTTFSKEHKGQRLLPDHPLPERTWF
ncbi:hypothetical protein ATANTOWER_020814 [Ataeniobius toweri]|uniref:Uncharacterized protein n=1 Tax=Ataeniobius toweri TaxID=208326 RepID=A0ABU7BZR2_9TELE|nr:hypothetical protein [Ataeniobius toweri]